MPSTIVESRAQRIARQDFISVGKKSGFFRGSTHSLVDIFAHRELLGLLVRRELKSRYKNSFLGLAWSLFRPLVQLAIYYFVIGKILGVSKGVPDFAIFVFIGLTMWGLFSEIVNSTTVSILSNSGLVKKVYLPREIFPLSAVGSALFNFLVQIIVLMLAILFLATAPINGDLLWLVPLSFLTLVVFSTACGLALAAFNVYLRDTQHFVEVATIILFWASPIVYSFASVHKILQGNLLEQVYLANPVTIGILGMQRVLWGAGNIENHQQEQIWPDNLELRLAATLAFSLLLLWLCQRLFSRLQGNFAQEL